MACKHITTSNRRAALRDGGRYFDRRLGRWICPWCDDWTAAVAKAAALEEERYKVALREGARYKVREQGRNFILWDLFRDKESDGHTDFRPEDHMPGDTDDPGMARVMARGAAQDEVGFAGSKWYFVVDTVLGVVLVDADDDIYYDDEDEAQSVADEMNHP
jgi:hypothetical protein